LADAHEHVKDGRIDFLHKLSEAIVGQEQAKFTLVEIWPLLVMN